MKAKKMTAFALASVLALTAAVPAMAADVTTAGGSAQQQVYAYTAKAASAYTTSVNVTVNWSSTNGAYSVAGNSYTWNPASHTYTQSAGSTVTVKNEPTMTITLTNNSDVYEDYSISYSKSIGAISESAASGSSKTGTLASYTAVNAVIPQALITITPSTGMAGKNTAVYTGEFSTDTDSLSLAGGATVTAGTYTVTLSASANDELVYTNSTGKNLSADALLASDTQTYIDPNTGKTVTAYNGFISQAFGSNWRDAMAFVQLLNENGVKPGSGENGTWRLLNSENDAEAWYIASGKPVYDSTVCFWTNTQKVDSRCAYEWTILDDGSYYIDTDGLVTDTAYDGYGFVVIWEPAA